MLVVDNVTLRYDPMNGYYLNTRMIHNFAPNFTCWSNVKVQALPISGKRLEIRKQAQIVVYPESQEHKLLVGDYQRYTSINLTCEYDAQVSIQATRFRPINLNQKAMKRLVQLYGWVYNSTAEERFIASSSRQIAVGRFESYLLIEDLMLYDGLEGECINISNNSTLHEWRWLVVEDGKYGPISKPMFKVPANQFVDDMIN